MRPFRERQVSGDDGRGALTSFGDDLKQQFGTDLGERYVAEFVDAQQFEAGVLANSLRKLELLLGLDEFVDEPRRGREPYSTTLLAGLYTQRGGEMGFASAGIAEKKSPALPARGIYPQ